MSKLTGEWDRVLSPEYSKPYYRELFNAVSNEYARYTVYPPKEDIFTAFHMTDLPDVRVVILGQDPYHGPGQAHGLCFSVREGVEPPPSLVNIYKELNSDLGIPVPETGCLEKWAGQGVFLLNTVLTVRAHSANSHKDYGWEQFTDAAIAAIDKSEKPVVFMLWGSHAQKKQALLHNRDHLVLKAPHPSPLSAYRGFFGCRHFSKANEYLTSRGEKPIDWSI